MVRSGDFALEEPPDELLPRLDELLPPSDEPLPPSDEPSLFFGAAPSPVDFFFGGGGRSGVLPVDLAGGGGRSGVPFFGGGGGRATSAQATVGIELMRIDDATRIETPCRAFMRSSRRVVGRSKPVAFGSFPSLRSCPWRAVPFGPAWDAIRGATFRKEGIRSEIA